MAPVSRAPIETLATIDTNDWTAVVHPCYVQLGSRVQYPTAREMTKPQPLEIRGAGTDRAEATIRFPDTVGTKHLALAWAPLRRWNIF